MKRVVSIILMLGVLVVGCMAADNLSIGGKAYLSYSSVSDTGVSAFTNTRVYLDIKRKLADNLFRYTTDIDHTNASKTLLCPTF